MRVNPVPWVSSGVERRVFTRLVEFVFVCIKFFYSAAPQGVGVGGGERHKTKCTGVGSVVREGRGGALHEDPVVAVDLEDLAEALLGRGHALLRPLPCEGQEDEVRGQRSTATARCPSSRVLRKDAGLQRYERKKRQNTSGHKTPPFRRNILLTDASIKLKLSQTKYFIHVSEDLAFTQIILQNK